MRAGAVRGARRDGRLGSESSASDPEPADRLVAWSSTIAGMTRGAADRSDLDRRELLARAAALAAALAAAPREAAADESAAEIAHVLATASHDRLLVKASLRETRREAPVLRVGRRAVAGERTDSAGLFWRFDVAGLEPATEYELGLADAGRRRLDQPWPLRTLPAPGAATERLRLLVYTCAGGHPDLPPGPRGRQFLPLATRQRLLRRALAFAPQAVIANGDHVYWDQTTGGRGRGIRAVPGAVELTGEFDRSLPVFGTENERVLRRAVDPQVAHLYGTMLRSLPVFFLQDDHDYFEGDAATESLVSFPPDPFALALGRATQRLYYPEFLPDANRPLGLPGASADDRPPGVGEAFGTLRWGKLLELLLWDCRRYLTLAGPVATFVPAEAERWILRRLSESDAAHVVNVPSVPIGWTAGKWGEWYPDVVGADGKLTIDEPKYFWQDGWRRQHDRILAAASAADRLPLFVCGDMHSIAEGVVRRSGEHDLARNPIVTMLVGALGTGAGWPSAARGTVARPSLTIEMDERQPCLEENGFALLDLEPERIVVSWFRWLPKQGEEAIDALEPFRVSAYPRRGVTAG
jgi:hypothetical protein